MRWARFCAGRGVTEGKRVLADAFAVDLPKAVIGRRGKVSWDGVCARTYAKNADAITRELERASSSLYLWRSSTKVGAGKFRPRRSLANS